jgi:predicted TIM-barrel fold metal-dependent hydrolase
VGFENALYRAYHRWVADFCAEGSNRLKWTLVANMRDVASGVDEMRHWADRDPNLVGIYLSPRGPGGELLDDPNLYPIYDAAQALDLTVLVHPGTGRPPYGPGTFDLGGAWFLVQSLCNSWSGMAATGALIGGGIFDLFPRLHAAVIETSGGWMPLAVERFEANFWTSPQQVPKLERSPRDVLNEGRYAHAIDTWEGTLEFLVESLGEDLWLFSTDFPHKGTQWPEGVQQIVDRPGLSESAKRKMLGENAQRVCPRLRN